jgi:hypothetical protein
VHLNSTTLAAQFQVPELLAPAVKKFRRTSDHLTRRPRQFELFHKDVCFDVCFKEPTVSARRE